jgi:hypothetical protein
MSKLFRQASRLNKVRGSVDRSVGLITTIFRAKRGTGIRRTEDPLTRPTRAHTQTKYKFELRVELASLALHPMHKEKDVVITLGKAGAAPTGAGRTASTPKPRKPAGPWGDTLALVVSLYRDRHGRYQPKPMQLVVKPAAGSGGASANAKPLAVFRLDASHFASAAGTKEACELQSVNKKVRMAVWMGAVVDPFGRPCPHNHQSPLLSPQMSITTTHT